MRAANGIHELLDKDGNWLKSEEEIQNEILLYKKLQGTASKNLVVIDREIMRAER